MIHTMNVFRGTFSINTETGTVSQQMVDGSWIAMANNSAMRKAVLDAFKLKQVQPRQANQPMTPERIAQIKERVQYTTVDPTGPFKSCPALTTLLIRVCKSDDEMFEEATRLIDLFVEQAIKEAIK